MDVIASWIGIRNIVHKYGRTDNDLCVQELLTVDLVESEPDLGRVQLQRTLQVHDLLNSQG